MCYKCRDFVVVIYYQLLTQNYALVCRIGTGNKQRAICSLHLVHKGKERNIQKRIFNRPRHRRYDCLLSAYRFSLEILGVSLDLCVLGMHKHDTNLLRMECMMFL